MITRLGIGVGVRLFVAALVAACLVAGCDAGVSNRSQQGAPERGALGQSTAIPPMEVIAPDACPFEGCQYGEWTARKTVPTYSSPDGSVLNKSIGQGQSITAVSGEVRAKPRRATITNAYTTDVEQGLDVGSAVYVLYPLGEGAVAVWHGGKVKHGSLDLGVHYDQPLESQPLDWTWWVLVRLADGTAGWVKNPQGQFDGMDRFA